jgi:hypothetical protein
LIWTMTPPCPVQAQYASAGGRNPEGHHMTVMRVLGGH